MYYTEGISHSNSADDSSGMHFRHSRHCQGSWLLFRHTGLIAFKWSERSPWPKNLSAKDLSGGQTQILSVRQIRTINHYPLKYHEDIAKASIRQMQNSLHFSRDLDSPKYCESNCQTDVDYDTQSDKGSEDQKRPVRDDVIATVIVPQLIRPTCTSRS
jgi:hypothetical protein